MSRVSCYFNLHKKVFSVKQERHPVAHFHWVLLRNCSFLVREGGRLRVLEEKRKGVHSYVQGELLGGNRLGEKENLSLIEDLLPKLSDEIRIRYNPYLYGHFFEATTLKPIYNCDLALLFNKQVFKI